MLAPSIDQPAYAWVISPLGVHLERVALRWLARAVRAARGVERHLHDRRDDGELTRSRAARAGGGAARASTSRSTASPDCRAYPCSERLRPRELARRRCRCSASAARRCAFARDAVGRVDLEALERGLQASMASPRSGRQRRRGERGRVRSHRRDGRPRRSLRRVAARRRRLRPVRATESAHGGARRGRRARRLRDGRRSQVAERARSTAASRSCAT